MLISNLNGCTKSCKFDDKCLCWWIFLSNYVNSFLSFCLFYVKDNQPYHLLFNLFIYLQAFEPFLQQTKRATLQFYTIQEMKKQFKISNKNWCMYVIQYRIADGQKSNNKKKKNLIDIFIDQNFKYNFVQTNVYALAHIKSILIFFS